VVRGNIYGMGWCGHLLFPTLKGKHRHLCPVPTAERTFRSIFSVLFLFFSTQKFPPDLVAVRSRKFHGKWAVFQLFPHMDYWAKLRGYSVYHLLCLFIFCLAKCHTALNLTISSVAQLHQNTHTAAVGGTWAPRFTKIWVPVVAVLCTCRLISLRKWWPYIYIYIYIYICMYVCVYIYIYIYIYCLYDFKQFRIIIRWKCFANSQKFQCIATRNTANRRLGW